MRYQGLSQDESKRRLKEYGTNQITQQESFSFIKQIWHVVKEPTFGLLLIVAALYAAVGEIKEVIVLSFAIFPIGGIQLFQNIKVDHTLQKLRNLMDYTTKVIREGEAHEIESKYIVPGDIIYITPGDKIPADGVLRSTQGLQVNESLLTGESQSVLKEAYDGDVSYFDDVKDLSLENTSLVFGGSLVVQGEGFVEVLRTGENTKYGKIGNLVQSIDEGENRLQKEVENLIKKLFVFSFILTLGMFIIILFNTGANWSLLLTDNPLTFFTSGNLVEALGLALTVAISSIPVELSVVFSVFLIVGARRIAKQNALVRRMTSIESLGSANIICVDKTGTLTKGELAVDKVFMNHQVFNRGEEPNSFEFRAFLKNIVLAGEKYSVDPIEEANQEYVQEYGLDLDTLYEEFHVFADFSFDQSKKMISHVYTHDEEQELFVFVGGAPERVLEVCNLSDVDKTSLLEKYRTLSQNGYRVLAYAHRNTNKEEINPKDRETVEHDLTFSGFVAMLDPVRSEVPSAVKTTYNAGIRLMMITGDGPETARSVANQIHLQDPDNVLTGKEVDELSDEELHTQLTQTNIYARILPEQKYRLVKLLQEQDKSVAMTGDGVNDAPAIKLANVGIAMGKRGTEVAREAADIILLDDNFATLVTTIRNGRRIYENLKKSLGYLVMIHLAMYGLTFFIPLISLPALLLPAHIIALEMILDPLAVLGFENEPPRSGIMERPPRSQEERFLSMHNIRAFISYGIYLFLMAFGWYIFLLEVDISEEVARTVSFLSLVVGQFVIVILTRNGSILERINLSTNTLMFSLFACTLVLLFSAIQVPSIGTFFQFHPLPWDFLLGVFIISGVFTSMVTILIHDGLGMRQYMK